MYVDVHYDVMFVLLGKSKAIHIMQINLGGKRGCVMAGKCKTQRFQKKIYHLTRPEPKSRNHFVPWMAWPFKIAILQAYSREVIIITIRLLSICLAICLWNIYIYILSYVVGIILFLLIFTVYYTIISTYWLYILSICWHNTDRERVTHVFMIPCGAAPWPTTLWLDPRLRLELGMSSVLSTSGRTRKERQVK